MDVAVVAVAKGRLEEPALALLREAGLLRRVWDSGDRRLFFPPEGPGEVGVLLCRSRDVPTFVGYGAADLGIVGKDVLWEGGPELVELADLGFGRGRLVVAAPEGGVLPAGKWRVATKFPRVAEAYFARQGRPVEVIPLHGAVELAPRMGLADAIVDFVDTGRTLRENGLRILEEIGTSTARLVANPVRYRQKDLRPLVQALVARAAAAAQP